MSKFTPGQAMNIAIIPTRKMYQETAEAIIKSGLLDDLIKKLSQEGERK